MKKPIFINHEKIRAEMKELQLLRDKTNQLWDLLWEFGISEPEAIKSPIEAVNSKLSNSIQNNSEFPVIPVKIAVLIGKELQYNQINDLSKFVLNHKLFDQIRFNKTKFSINGAAEKNITEKNTVYLTDPKEIELANRIQSFVDEAHYLAEIFRFRIFTHKFLDFFPLLRLEDGELVINHYKFEKIMSMKSPKPV